MKTECTTLRKTINQSLQVVCRLDKTVMARWVNIKCNVTGQVWWSWQSISLKTHRLSLLIQLKNKGLCHLALTAFDT